MKHFLAATERVRLDVGYRDRPIIIGIAQIVAIREVVNPAAQGEDCSYCEVQLTGDVWVRLVESFAEVARACGAALPASGEERA